jgi:hypothetical protein
MIHLQMMVMKNTLRHILSVLAASAALLIAGPQQGMAQRFNHAPAGGGRPAAPPVFHPAPVTRPAPVIRQTPAQARPAEPRQQVRPTEPRPEVRPTEPRPEPHPAEPGADGRPTINGGGRNIGNHDLSRPMDVHSTVNVRSNVTVRDHVNVYHTGGDHGVHPYYYHPYRPYYWGPHWHPVGFFLSALAADAIWFNFNSQRYWYDDGCFYLSQNGGYAVVAAPVGAVVTTLPQGYETPVASDGQTYYYYAGVFYVALDQGGYQVVAAPPGAIIYNLPQGAVDQQIDGQDFLVYDNTFFEPVSQDGQDAYAVVPPPGQ